MKKIILLASAFCLLTSVFADDSATADKFFFHDGDRVVFLGDSITEQRLYTTYIEAYTLARYPKWKLSFRNAGWGGDTSWLRQRAHPDEGKLFAASPEAQQAMVEKSVGFGLGRDVLPLQPTAITIKFGMNDHSYQPFNEKIFNAYVRSQTELAKELKANGARVAFLTPQPIEDNKRADVDQDVKNQSLRKFSDGLKQVAADNGAAFADQFDPYMAMLLRERKDNPKTFVGAGDAVHPGPTGHTVMAWAVLKALGATPMVSRAEIDPDMKRPWGLEHCKIENFKFADGVVSFDRTDEALPLPIDSRAKAALKLAPVLDDLSRYELKVTGLSATNYDLTIDGEAAGSFSRQELAAGVNLTTAKGPIAQQTARILKLVFDKNNAYYERWRNVQLFDTSNFPKWAKDAVEEQRKTVLERLDKQIADLEEHINAARQPKPHHFELKPAA